jgi:hypothetical protein
MYIVVAILLLVVIIFGVSSTSQSYATAQQAKAQIELAQVAQVNAWGNLVSILMIAMVLVIFVALVAAVLWILYKRSSQRSALSSPRSMVSNQPRLSAQAGLSTPSDMMEKVLQLEMLKILQSYGLNAPVLPAPREEEPADESLDWLR